MPVIRLIILCCVLPALVGGFGPFPVLVSPVEPELAESEPELAESVEEPAIEAIGDEEDIQKPRRGRVVLLVAVVLLLFLVVCVLVAALVVPPLLEAFL